MYGKKRKKKKEEKKKKKRKRRKEKEEKKKKKRGGRKKEEEKRRLTREAHNVTNGAMKDDEVSGTFSFEIFSWVKERVKKV